MEIQMQLSLDNDGFLRRECPHCELEFKWHHGPTDAAPEDFVYPDVYCCPRCGRSATHDAWWTQEQLAYQRELVTSKAHDHMGDMLRTSLGRAGGRGFKVKVTPGSSRQEAPAPPFEPDDMMMISPPCHPWEPVKVPDDAAQPHYCLICGQGYAV